MSTTPTPPTPSGGSNAQSKALSQGRDVQSVRAQQEKTKGPETRPDSGSSGSSSSKVNQQEPKDIKPKESSTSSKDTQASVGDKLQGKTKDAKDYVDIASGRGYQGPNNADHGTQGEKAVDNAVNMGIKQAASVTPVSAAAERGVSAGKDLIKKKADDDPDSVAATMVRGTRTAKRGVLGALVVNELLKVAALYAMFQFIKGLLVKLLMLASKILQFLGNVFMAVAQGFFGAIGTAFMAGATAIGSAFGLGTVGSVIAMGTSVLVGGGAAVSGVATVAQEVRDDISVRSDMLVAQCLAQLEVAATNNSSVGPVSETEETANTKAETEKNAKMIYSVMKSENYPDVAIAGVLGNFSRESGIDATAVETIRDEPFRIGPQKKAAIEADFLLDVYAPGAYDHLPYPVDITYSGIGYGQWTNDRNRSLLAFAKKVGKNWYEADVQMAFMLTGDEKSRRDILAQMKSMGDSSVEDTTVYFMSKWEGITDPSTGARIDAAKHWYIEMADWAVDPNARKLLDEAIEKGGGSVVDSVESSKTDANRSAVDRIASECQAENGSSSLANSVNAVWNGDLGDGEWTNPCPECVVVSPFAPRFLGDIDSKNGNFHWGWDMARQDGAIVPIIAPTDIKITDFYANDGCLFGRATDSDVGFGFCHMGSVDVEIGDTVTKGTVLGTEGGMMGGNPNGAVPHLHFEMYKPGSAFENFAWFNDRSLTMDPKPAFEAKGVDIVFQ